MTITNFCASFGASVFIVCLYGLLAILAVILGVTLWKCVFRPLWACVHKARVMRPAVRPCEISWAEYRRMNHPRRLL